MKYDSIIIGGGISGLVCGISLLKAGQKVAIVSSGQSALHFNSGAFDGQLKIAGRLRASYFLKLLWKLVWSKEVRMTYRHVRNFEL